MGFPGEPQSHVIGGSGLDLDGSQWVIAGISLRAPLKPVYTKPVESGSSESCYNNNYDAADEGKSCTTPTSEESRISSRLTCPAAPRKRKARLMCNYSGIREFFTPPDLEAVFVRHVGKAK